MEVSGEDSSQSKEPVATGVEKSAHGFDFQVQLLMFFAYQGYQISQKDEKYLFEIGKEIKEAGKFDDIVFRYKKDQHREEWNYLLLQAKHLMKVKESDKISASKLLSSKSKDPFNLLKYFSSYVQSKNNYEGDVIESCIIATNNNFLFEKNEPLKLAWNDESKQMKTENSALPNEEKIGKPLYLKELERKNINPILHTSEFNDAKFYQFDQEKGTIVEELMKQFRNRFASINKEPRKQRQQKKLQNERQENKQGQEQPNRSTDEEVLENLEKLMKDDKKFEEELRGFLNTLLFVVNLPGRTRLLEITKEKIGAEFYFRGDSIVSEFNSRMLQFTISPQPDLQKFLSKDQIKDIFLEMDRIIVRSIPLTSYYNKIDNSKVDFTNKGEIYDLLNTKDKKILLIKAKSMFLTAVKINCVLKDRSLDLSFKQRYGYKGGHSFVYLKELLEIEDYTQTVIQFFGHQRGCDLLTIIFDAGDGNKMLKLLDSLNNAAEKSSEKKVVLITEPNCDVNFPSYVKEQHVQEAYNFSDLTYESKMRVLDKMIPFQETAKIPLKQLYFKLPNSEENPSPKQLNLLDIDAKSLECLEKDCIKIGKPFSVSDLEGAYTKLYEKIDVNTLLEKLQEPIDNFIISGINEAKKKDAFIEKLKDASGKQVISFKESQLCERKFERGKVHKITRRIMLTGAEFAEQDFRKLCHDNPNKSVIYWIIWKDNKFILNSLYFPKTFLERRFNCPEQSVAYGDLETELDEPNSAFFITGVESLEELHLEESVRTKLEEKRDFGNVLLHATDRNKRSAFNNFTETIRQRNDNKYVCWLEFENYGEGQFVWKDVTRRKIWEDELIEFIKNKSAIIIDKPGMGKTTILTLLSEKMLESHWVILITLRDCKDAIDDLPDNYDEINADVVIKFIFGTNNLITSFERHLAKYILNKADGNKPLLLLFDGFDEINCYTLTNINKMKVEKLLKYLKKETEATVWVTAREHDVTTLKNTLSVFDIKLDEVNDDEQRKYFCNTWKSSLALRAKTDEIRDIFDGEDCKFQKYYNELSSTAKAILENQSNDFMGIPLTLRLFAEAFRSKFEKFITDEEENLEDDFNNLSVLNLYQYFIDEKFNIYLREKTTLASSLTAESESWFKYLPIKFHFWLAFREVHGDRVTENIVGIIPPFKKEDGRLQIESEKLAELLKLGIIRSTKNDHYEFLHRTLAEYFVSLMFLQLLRNKRQTDRLKYNKMYTFLRRNILMGRYEVIKIFLNAMSEEDTAFKEIWNLIIRHRPEENLLAYTNNRHKFSMINREYGDMREDILSIGSRCANDHIMPEGSRSLYCKYCDDASNLPKLIKKCTQENSSDELQCIMADLLKLTKIQPDLLVKESVSDILDRYIVLTGIDQGVLNIKFVKKCLRVINMINDNKGQTPTFEIPQSISSSSDATRRWLKFNGVKIVKETMCLTPEMVAKFTPYCRGDGYFVLRVFNNLIRKLLSLKYLSKFDPALFSKIDTFSLVQMFKACTGNERVYNLELSETSLEGLLVCIRQLLHPDAVSLEHLTVCAESLMALTDWNFCLTFENSSLALHYESENGEYNCLLNLQHEDKIVKFINVIRANKFDPVGPRKFNAVVNCILKRLKGRAEHLIESQSEADFPLGRLGKCLGAQRSGEGKEGRVKFGRKPTGAKRRKIPESSPEANNKSF